MRSYQQRWSRFSRYRITLIEVAASGPYGSRGPSTTLARSACARTAAQKFAGTRSRSSWSTSTQRDGHMRRCHDRHRRCARCVASSGGPGEHAERLSGIVRNLFRRHPDPWTLYLGSGFAPPFDYTDFLGRFAAAFGRDSLIGRPYRTTAPDDALIGSFERLLLRRK